MSARRLAFVVSIVMLVPVACDAGDQGAGGTRPEQQERTITIKGDKANDHGSREVTQPTTEIELGDYYFEPTILRGGSLQPLDIKATNEGDTRHNFSVRRRTRAEELISVDVPPGAERDLRVTFPASGTLVFFCKYHEQRGMRGALQAAAE